MATLTVQVATQFSSGTGLLLPARSLVIASERVVCDSASVVVSIEGVADQLARVVYLDAVNDLALLHIEDQGELVLPPVTDEELTAYISANGLDHLETDKINELLADFESGGGHPASRCFDCKEIVFETGAKAFTHCPHCGTEILMPSALEDPRMSGIDATIETIITEAGFDPRLARRGPYLWHIQKGSARIEVTYHEDSGLVTGDAYLCKLPEEPGAEVFAYLLRENFTLSQLALSTYGRDVVLSLLIYDRYLRVDTALPQFEHLFERADAYDDVLVERFGGDWRVS